MSDSQHFLQISQATALLGKPSSPQACLEQFEIFNHESLVRCEPVGQLDSCRQREKLTVRSDHKDAAHCHSHVDRTARENCSRYAFTRKLKHQALQQHDSKASPEELSMSG